MEQKIVDGLIGYLCLVLLVTFHEFGHAWMAWKRGDDTARLLGRISLNPLVHMDLLGTVVLPLAAVFLGAMGSGLAGLIIGWGKPVPVNSARLRHRGFDWMLIALAGPAMNLLLAMVAVGLIRVGNVLDLASVKEIAFRLAELNLFLCFFNLLPIPPLDGSHVARYFLNIREDIYQQSARYGFFLVLVSIQFAPVQMLLSWLTFNTLGVMMAGWGVS